MVDVPGDPNHKTSTLIDDIKSSCKLYYYLDEDLTGAIYNSIDNKIYIINNAIENLKEIFEDKNILKIGYKLKQDSVLLKQNNITSENMMFDIEIAAYILNASKDKYTIEELAKDYLNMDVGAGLCSTQENMQLDLFTEAKQEDNSKIIGTYVFCIFKLHEILTEKLKETNQLDLFNNIEMPLLEVLADMEYTGIHVDKEALVEYGNELKKTLGELTREIYELVGQEFNINSPKQLGEILFEKLNLPSIKKTKTGYSTDVDVLEKLKSEHPVVEKLLEYRQLSKLNSTYVEGMIPYIEDNRIHSIFHQTVTTTGRISSTEPNLQNIPIKFELGKKLRKIFTAPENTVLLDADYSQIELRVLAHMANDENMVEAFKNDEDIHSQAASKVFNVPLEKVTKELRSQAKAVNFGIVYGISEFGLGENLGIGRKKAKEYIDQYLEKYAGIKIFMDNIIETAKKQGYVETLFNRIRYIPEINSNNYMVRQFGNRVALNTPIQGTAADIIKIAMINVYRELKTRQLESKLILQVHDELLLEVKEKELDEVKSILKNCMENAITLNVPLKVDIEQGKNWYDAK